MLRRFTPQRMNICMRYKYKIKNICITKGAFTNPPGPVRFSNPTACRRISRPCGALPNFISTASMVTYPTEPGQYAVDI